MPAPNPDLFHPRLRETDLRSVQEHLRRAEKFRYGMNMGRRYYTDLQAENTKRFYLPHALENLLDSIDNLESRQ